MVFERFQIRIFAQEVSVIGQYFRAEKDNMDRKCKDVLQLGAMKIKHYRIRAILEESTETEMTMLRYA